MRKILTIVACLGACGALVWLGRWILNPKPQVVDVTAAPNVVYLDQGLSPAERTMFFHEAEGSEVAPLSWVEASLSETGNGKPFMKELERFGLLWDPDDKLGLPVGITAAPSVDIRYFSDVKMIGVNCAACHVGEVAYVGTSIRILGAPNLFDIEGFYGALAVSLKDNFSSFTKFREFLGRLYPLDTGAASTPMAPRSYELLESSQKRSHPVEKLTDDELQKAFAKELETDVRAEDAAEGLRGRPWAGPAVELSADLKKALSEVESDSKIKGMQGLTTGADRENAIKNGLSDFIRTLRLLRARVAFLLALGPSQKGAARPGPGRVDAFGSARNLMFPKAAQPKTAPVRYPHLWGFGKVGWLHWDANTTSIMERNVGQAIGLGAIFDADSGASTILPRSLHKLEGLARRLKAPTWPENVFGPLTAEKVKRGGEIYAVTCTKCHALQRDESADVRLALDMIKTDPSRAKSFAVPVETTKFSDKLSEILPKVKRAAYEREHLTEAEQKDMDGGRDSSWRTTEQYVARPLFGVWASGPYLHNASVPTLYDLLRPVGDRPKTFKVGHRDFDPKRVGYTIDPKVSPSEFDTIPTGNRNTGHEGHDYGTDLSEEDRQSLLEYLKSLREPDGK